MKQSGWQIPNFNFHSLHNFSFIFFKKAKTNLKQIFHEKSQKIFEKLLSKSRGNFIYFFYFFYCFYCFYCILLLYFAIKLFIILAFFKLLSDCVKFGFATFFMHLKSPSKQTFQRRLSLQRFSMVFRIKTINFSSSIKRRPSQSKPEAKP